MEYAGLPIFRTPSVPATQVAVCSAHRREMSDCQCNWYFLRCVFGFVATLLRMRYLNVL